VHLPTARVDRPRTEIPTTMFAAEQVLDRAELQRLLRGRRDILIDDALIVSEEFARSPTPSAASTRQA